MREIIYLSHATLIAKWLTNVK